MQRLQPDRLDTLPAEVARPGYDRSALRAGIVHLGAGAFQRAHLAAVNDAALAASGDLRWGIVGVSLRSADTRDALAPQQGLYTLALREAGEEGEGRGSRESLRVVGCLLAVLVAPEDPAAVLDRIAHADTRILSLTVTEKGYCHDPATGRIVWSHPEVRHDLAHPEAPRGVLGFIVHGLRLRQSRGLSGITLMSLDNLPSNGHLLRGLVLDFAGRVDTDLARWIAEQCSFPCSMVDRIVPRTTDADRAAVAASLGLEDAWPVVGETFLDWAVEDDFTAGRPDWTLGGARFVADARPYEVLKLRMVNGAHSALAYLGAVAGWATVDLAVQQPPLRDYLDRLMREEVVPTLPAMAGLDTDAYRRRLLQRFANPALAHRTQQIAMDGSQKLPQRLLGTVRARLIDGKSIDALALAVAAWLHYLAGRDEQGGTYEVSDPLGDALAERLELAGRAATAAAPERATAAWVGSFVGFAPVFGEDLAGEPEFVSAVARALEDLRAHGVVATLTAFSQRRSIE